MPKLFEILENSEQLVDAKRPLISAKLRDK